MASSDMNFDIPPALVEHLARLDAFIAREITPLQNQDDNNRFFDHRREHARTDWDRGGLPREDWEELLGEAVRRADKAGFWRFSLPQQEYGGQNVESGRGSNLWMAVMREHMASKGVVGNFPDVIMVQHFGSPEQKQELIHGRLQHKVRITFGLTEPGHGSDATFMATRGEKQADGSYMINGGKMWQTGMHKATHCFIFARTSGKDGEAKGITCFVVPRVTPGVKVESYEWTLNMPTDHATVSLTNVHVPVSAVLGPLGGGLAVAQAFVHENRIRQAASSLGAAVYCVNQSVAYARKRQPFGKPLAANQAIQFPLVELATQCEMLRLLIRKTAVDMDRMHHVEVESRLGDKVSMCNYWANRLCTEAADRAIQVHGGWGYSRHCQFEHIWRHHRRYRITEGSEEIQMRKVAGYLFGFMGPKKFTTTLKHTCREHKILFRKHKILFRKHKFLFLPYYEKHYEKHQPNIHDQVCQAIVLIAAVISFGVLLYFKLTGSGSICAHKNVGLPISVALHVFSVVLNKGIPEYLDGWSPKLTRYASLFSLIFAIVDQWIQGLEEELGARNNTLEACKQELETCNKTLETLSNNFEELNNKLEKRTLQVELLRLDLRQLKAGRKALLDNIQADTPPKSPASDRAEVRNLATPSAKDLVVVQRDPAAVAAARENQAGLTLVFQKDEKYLRKPYRPRDEGAALRDVTAQWPASDLCAVELKPGDKWELTLFPQYGNEDDELVLNGMELDPEPALHTPELKVEAQATPAVSAPGQWDETDEDWVVESGKMPNKQRSSASAHRRADHNRST
ncbi:hypothetical protein LTR08_001017 [Meristemomyces frigidus]|nr:hypothetical protein LTR08_001017 [Meristemomyces frigidus]